MFLSRIEILKDTPRGRQQVTVTVCRLFSFSLSFKWFPCVRRVRVWYITIWPRIHAETFIFSLLLGQTDLHWVSRRVEKIFMHTHTHIHTLKNEMKTWFLFLRKFLLNVEWMSWGYLNLQSLFGGPEPLWTQNLPTYWWKSFLKTNQVYVRKSVTLFLFFTVAKFFFIVLFWIRTFLHCY